MSRLVLLWLTIFIGPLFLIIAWPDLYVKPFLSPDCNVEITLQSHVWYICNKVTIIIFAWIMLQLSEKYRVAMWTFFGCKVLVLLDYFWCYNEVWVYIWDDVPLTSNLLTILLFSLSIVYEAIYGQRND